MSRVDEGQSKNVKSEKVTRPYRDGDKPASRVKSEKVARPYKDDDKPGSRVKSEKVTLPYQDDDKPASRVKSEKVTRPYKDDDKPASRVKSEKVTLSYRDDDKPASRVKSEKVTLPYKDDDKPASRVKSEKVTRPYKDDDKPASRVKSEKVTRPYKDYDKPGSRVKSEKVTRPYKDDDKPGSLVKSEKVTQPYKDDYKPASRVKSEKVTLPYKDGDKPGSRVKSEKVALPYKYGDKPGSRVKSEKVALPYKDGDKSGSRVKSEKVALPYKDDDKLASRVKSEKVRYGNSANETPNFRRGTSANGTSNSKRGISSNDTSNSKRGISSNDTSNSKRGISSNDTSNSKSGISSNYTSNSKRGISSNDTSNSKRGFSSNDTSNSKRGFSSNDTSNSKRDISSNDTSNSKRDISSNDTSNSKRGFSSNDTSNSKRDISSNDTLNSKRDISSNDTSNSKRDISSNDTSNSKRGISSNDTSNSKRDISSNDTSNSKRDISSNDTSNSKRDISSNDTSNSKRGISANGTSNSKRGTSANSISTPNSNRGICTSETSGSTKYNISARRDTFTETSSYRKASNSNQPSTDTESKSPHKSQCVKKEINAKELSTTKTFSNSNQSQSNRKQNRSGVEKEINAKELSTTKTFSSSNQSPSNRKQNRSNLSQDRSKINQPEILTIADAHTKENKQSEILTIADLNDLKRNDANSILLTLTKRGGDFLQILNKPELSQNEVCLIMELIAKSCSGLTQSPSIFKLLQDVDTSVFIHLTIPTALSEMTNDVSTQTLRVLTKLIEDLLDFLLQLALRLPHSITTVTGFYSILEQTRTSITKNGMLFHDTIDQKMKQLTDAKISILKRMESERLKVISKPVVSPPSDFRVISIIPTYDDIYPTRKTFLRKIKPRGGFSDLDEYLDVQFRLLREDFIQPLRQGITEYLVSIDDPSQHVSVSTYNDIRVLHSEFEKEKFVHTITFDTKNLKHIQWDDTKRLMYGTLVCLSNDNFRSFSLATVVSGPEIKQTKRGSIVTLDIFIEPIIGERIINIYMPMVMVETPVYFESCRHVLASLQNIREGQLPFEDYIVHCKTDVKPPAYLKNEPNIKYDFSSMTQNSRESANVKRAHGCEYKADGGRIRDNADVYCVNDSGGIPAFESDGEHIEMTRREDSTDDELNKTSSSDDSETINARESILDLNWPRAEDLHLDAIQFQAFQQALTKEFVIMQGPPGTGKTYVGLQIVKALLANSTIWQQDTFRRPPRPMLVVCYTNHALDQFLEGILSFHTGKLVRIGSQSKNEMLANLGLKQMRESLKISAIYCDNLRDTYIMCQTSLHKIQEQLATLHDGIVSAIHLKDFIKQNHYHTLTDNVFGEWTLLVWLNLIEAVHISTTQKQYRCVGGHDLFVDDSENMNDLRYTRKLFLDITFRTILIEVSEEYHPYLLNQIQSTSLMTEYEAKDVGDIWSLQHKQRWRLYRFWLHQLQEHLETEMHRKQQECITVGEEYRVARLQTDKAVMERCSVIGMTTSGAARYQKVLSDIKPRIIIIEEAAEVLEGHVIAALSSECQHLILIGDHQQLRPSTNVYVLAKRYNLELSLFERMVNNGLQCICLEKQHRMRPSISRIMKHIYPNLRDDESVQDFPDILGVCNNVFFINHLGAEERNNELKSHLNIFEARYVTALCLYLIKQGYAPNRITILTTYSAQVAYLRQNMPTETFEGVKVTSVDNYQGEENDIILLSLVRSNLEGNIGFLKIDNRVCVALSRAKKGLYVIGNFQLLRKQSSLWKNIIDDLKSEGHIGPALGLYCQNHPNDSGIKASKPEDFLLAPEGGCIKACLFRLNCGHMCASPCHPVDPEHLKYQCNKPCEKVIPSCEHKQQVPCWKDPNDFRCMHPVMHKGKCGHKVEVSCSERDVPCKAACNTVLKCGHTCTGLCHQCSQGRLHVPCTKPCNKILICGHECQSICSSCPPCELICKNRCVHGICGGRCGDPCTPCNEPCAWTCKDKKCTKRCSEPCNRQRCDKRCPRMLKCRHRCIGLFGEICPVLCRKCNEDDVRTYLPEKGNFTDALFVQLEDCGHIVEVSALDTWVKDSSESKRIHLTQCPWCLTCIRKNLRYGDAIKQTMVDLDTVKIQIKEEESIWATKTDNESKEQKQSVSGSHEIKTLYKNAVQTLQGRIAVQNQTRILKCIHGILKCLYEVTSSTISYYQYNRQFQREQYQFQRWLLEQREVFTEQEASDAENELKRLRLFIDVQYFEIKMNVSRKPLSEEQQSNFEVVRQYLLDGNRYTLERQQKFDETLSDLAVFLGISEERALVMSSIQKQEAECVIHMPMKFTADHWFKCNEGHIYYVSAGGDTAVCPRCASKLGGTNSTQQDNLLATTSDDSSGHIYAGCETHACPRCFGKPGAMYRTTPDNKSKSTKKKHARIILNRSKRGRSSKFWWKI